MSSNQHSEYSSLEEDARLTALRSCGIHALGTLCIIDYVPREFTQEQRDALQTLSSHLMAQGNSAGGQDAAA